MSILYNSGCKEYPKDISPKDIEDNSPGKCFSTCELDETVIGLMGKKVQAFRY